MLIVLGGRGCLHVQLDLFPSFLRTSPQKYSPTKVDAEYHSEQVLYTQPCPPRPLSSAITQQRAFGICGVVFRPPIASSHELRAGAKVHAHDCLCLRMLSRKYGAPTTSVRHVMHCAHPPPSQPPPDPNLPADGTQFQAAIPSDVPSARMTSRRPKNACVARNPTLAKPTS